MQRIDTATLARVIEQLVILSGDNRFTPAQQGQLMALAKRLRGTFVNLVSATFESNTPELVEANEKLKVANERLKSALDNINEIVQTIETIGALVKVLDDLIGLAKAFI